MTSERGEEGDRGWTKEAAGSGVSKDGKERKDSGPRQPRARKQKAPGERGTAGDRNGKGAEEQRAAATAMGRRPSGGW